MISGAESGTKWPQIKECLGLPRPSENGGADCPSEFSKGTNPAHVSTSDFRPPEQLDGSGQDGTHTSRGSLCSWVATAWRRLTWRPGKQEEAISGLEDRGETSEQSEWRGGHVGELNLPNGKRKGGGEKGR